MGYPRFALCDNEVVFKIDWGWPNLAELILSRVRTARDSDFEIVHQVAKYI